MGKAAKDCTSAMFLAQPDAARDDPLFVQIADGVRYGIGSGHMGPGDRLPTAVDAANSWGVNHHTVRRAYGALADEGLITVLPRVGARVRWQHQTAANSPMPLSGFLDAMLHHAERAYGLDPDDLADLIRTRRRKTRQNGVVVVMECTADQAAHHGEELGHAFGMDTVAFCLDGHTEPPEGPILGTYFHLSEIAARWPHRLGDVVIVAVEPSAEIVDSIRQQDGSIPDVVLHETNGIRAGLMADQLRHMPALGGTRIFIELSDTVGPETDQRENIAHLYAPKNWAQLSWSARGRARHDELPFQITPLEIKRLAPLLDQLN